MACGMFSKIEHDRKRYLKRKQNGLCVNCGVSKAERGVRCISCINKKIKRKRGKKK